jgi:two-component system OmpR family response regulator/two-component system response regulator CpxR
MHQAHPITSRPSVLLVDDDLELIDLLHDYLERDGFNVTCRHDGRSGVDAALTGLHDIAVIDVMMPGLDGFQVLSIVRASSSIPVIMLTARGDDTDRIAGLEHGADDYVPKPCSPRELAARLRAILKRLKANETQTSEVIAVGTLTIWPGQRRAEDSGRQLELTSTEFSLLEVLARNVGRPVSKAQLSDEAINRPLARFDRTIDVHIHSIRNKLKPGSDGRSRIQTIIRKGYLLIAD